MLAPAELLAHLAVPAVHHQHLRQPLATAEDPNAFNQELRQQRLEASHRLYPHLLACYARR